MRLQLVAVSFLGNTVPVIGGHGGAADWTEVTVKAPWGVRAVEKGVVKTFMGESRFLVCSGRMGYTSVLIPGPSCSGMWSCLDAAKPLTLTHSPSHSQTHARV